MSSYYFFDTDNNNLWLDGNNWYDGNDHTVQIGLPGSSDDIYICPDNPVYYINVDGPISCGNCFAPIVLVTGGSINYGNFNNDVSGVGNILSGTFGISAEISGTVYGGSFSTLAILNGGVMVGGTVTNAYFAAGSTVAGGTFPSTIVYSGATWDITGTLDLTGLSSVISLSSLTVENTGILLAGDFSGVAAITNYGTISGGNYAGGSNFITINGGTINGGTFSGINLTWINVDSKNVANATISGGCTLTANGVSVVDAGGNTLSGNTYVRENGGYFNGFGFGNGIWSGNSSNDLADAGNWDLIPIYDTLWTATIPDNRGLYPQTGTAKCTVNVGAFGSDLTASLQGGTYNGAVVSYGSLSTYFNGSNLSFPVYNSSVDSFGQISGGEFNAELTLEDGSSLTDAGFTLYPPVVATNINNGVIYKAGDAGVIVSGSVTFANIKKLAFCNAPVLTKEKGINGSGILGII